MTFHDWLKGFASRWSRQTRRVRPTGTRRSPLSFDALEERTVPSFASPVNYPVGTAPTAIVSGDFDNDLNPDLALVNPGNNTVSVLLGNGDGTFAAAPNATTGATPVSLAVGDFDGDTNLDIATANAAGVSVLLGNGDGTFDPPSTIPFSDSMPSSIAVGDFNGDGLLDLGVVANQVYYYTGYYGGTYATYNGAADVLIGDGDGGFTGTGLSGLGNGWFTGAAAGDFNGDDRDDLATANTWYGYVYTMLSDASGAPVLNSSYYPGGSAAEVTAADADGDGDVDLIAANGWSGNVGILPGDGSGVFGAAQSISVGGYAADVVVGDFNDDSRMDLAVANNSTHNINVLLRRTDGTYTPSVNSESVAGAHPRGITADDFDGDGWLDAATANYSNNTSVLLNDGEWPNADAPLVTINNVSVTEGNAGTANATFTVTLSTPASEPVTIHYSTADGSAGSGDYTPREGDIEFAPGQQTGEIVVPVVGDILAEPNETFLINISSNDSFVTDAQGMATIVDDDIRITVNNVTKKEGTQHGKNGSTTTQFIFTVSLSAPAIEPITVNYATANGSATLADNDYQSKVGTLTFAAGQTSKTVVVLVTADKRREGDDWFALNLSESSTNALILDSQGIGTMTNDDRK